MDPLCISLVQQFLESTKSTLSAQFKTRYQAKETNVKVEDVLSKWNEDQMARSIVYQHLRTVAPSLALDFKDTHYCSFKNVPELLMKVVEMTLQMQTKDTTVKLEESEEELTRSIVHHHLNRVTPSLALEFRDTYSCTEENVPEQLVEFIQKSLSQK